MRRSAQGPMVRIPRSSCRVCKQASTMVCGLTYEEPDQPCLHNRELRGKDRNPGHIGQPVGIYVMPR